MGSVILSLSASIFCQAAILTVISFSSHCLRALAAVVVVVKVFSGIYETGQTASHCPLAASRLLRGLP